MTESEKIDIGNEPVYYISGIHALNIPCSLDTSGDWHRSALAWNKERLTIKNSGESIWGNYGIEISEDVPENPGKYFVANHIRACLDLIADERYPAVQQMREGFIGDENIRKKFSGGCQN